MLVVAALAAAFFVGMFAVIWLSLRGEEVKVPEIIGKDYYDGEKEVAQLGLRIKRRATRYSKEKPNTILEQLPKAGETVKTGQTILVVLSEANPEGSEEPATVENSNSEQDVSNSSTAESATRPNKNSNVKRPSQMTRDIIANKVANSGSGNSVAATNGSSSSNAKPIQTPVKVEAPAANRVIIVPSANRTSPPPSAKPPKPANAATPSGGDLRNRRTP
jgi:beta-lactam-binding protein with PASTA domain